MHPFHYAADRLHAEAVDLAAIAALHGTPTYVYSAAAMEANFRRITGAFPGVDLRVCYAMKANSSAAVLRLFTRLGAGFDLVSGGELHRVQAAGGSPADSVFAGVGKSEPEIRQALEAGVAAFHVESDAELERIDRLAGRAGRKAPVALRVNPDVDAGTHAKITTGKRGNKFGVPLDDAERTYAAAAARFPHVELVGIQMHIGSQITAATPFVAAVEKIAPVAARLRDRHGLRYFSVGGGLGIEYREALASGDAAWWKNRAPAERPPTPEEYGAALSPVLRGLGLRVLLEPGRFLVGNAGVLLARVEYVKRTAERNFVILDAAMNDLLRPAMYDAFHEIVPLTRDARRPRFTADVVGGICESSDCFAKDRELPELGEGELVAFLSAGAYGAAMANRYNSRPLPAEVMVRGANFEVVSPRETFADLTARESIPTFLR